jgi:tetratricopeptide (TPR) repeat protein
MIRRLVLALLIAGPGIAQAQTAGLDCGRLNPADRAAYNTALQRGGADNVVRNYAAALTAYQQAVDLQVRGCGRSDPSQAFALSHVGLQQSNLGRFAEADQTFARVSALLGSVDPMVRGRALHNMALNAANQKHWADALALADKADDAYLQAAPSLQALADNPPLQSVDYGRPQRLLEARDKYLDGRVRTAAASLRVLFASAAYWAKNLGDGAKAEFYQRRSHALTVAINNGL